MMLLVAICALFANIQAFPSHTLRLRDIYGLELGGDGPGTRSRPRTIISQLANRPPA
ncbi:hypothetical protein EAG_05042 [Camponotus floridanus]|uniref:Uncharacterized protein n=1 Tax=Camponotus floridanus TaxID=104421 RepID=E2AK26_CAMFO|nr:hypothetical protein EAG_05042 [Camponotus floridanus]